MVVVLKKNCFADTMKSADAFHIRKRKNFKTQVLEEYRRNKVISTISSYLFSYRAQHYGLDNLCPLKIYSAILYLDYNNNSDFFLESYPDKNLAEVLGELAIVIYNVIEDTNVLELMELQLETEEIKDVLIGQYMYHYKYTGNENFDYWCS